MTRILSGAFVLSFVVLACGEPEGDSSSSAGGSAGQAGKGGTAGGGGQSGMATGGQGTSGQPTGGSAGASEDGGSGGASAACTFPESSPVSGAECPEACEGELVAYEDCEGEGFIQAACADAWFLVGQECGDHLCENPGFDGESCALGSVCVEQQGGAQLFECRQHDCGTGPITCDCLAEACPGLCNQTGVLDFTCNICPEGNCP